MVRSYSFTAKFLHWAFIAVFAFGVINQVDEVEELESPTLLAGEVIFAMIFLSLLLVRFLYMQSARAAMPQLDMSKNLILLARTMYFGNVRKSCVDWHNRVNDWRVILLRGKGGYGARSYSFVA